MTLDEPGAAPRGSGGDRAFDGVGVERNLFFDGKFMCAADFALDPDYFLARQRLGARLFHGWGVAEGLGVVPHPEPRCRESRVVIEPGLALDKRGRLLVLARALPVRIAGDGGEIGDALLGVRYAEEEIEPEPVLVEDCDAGAGRTRPGRVRETVEPVLWLDVPPEPAWPDVPFVPLARIRRRRDGRLAETTFGRPDLQLRPARIQALGWPGDGGRPGGCLAEDEVWSERHLGGRITLTFDRDLWTGTGDGRGVDAYTFRVELGSPQGERVPVRGRAEARGRQAIFEIDRGRCPPVDGKSFFVTLMCDYVLDARGYPVAAAPPGGPENRPVQPGGIFQTWFRVGGAPRDTKEAPS